MAFRQNSSKFGMSAVVNECVLLGKGHFEKCWLGVRDLIDYGD